MSDERLRKLERAIAEDTSDLVVLRELADERRRRGLEFLPDRRRGSIWGWLVAGNSGLFVVFITPGGSLRAFPDSGGDHPLTFRFMGAFSAEVLGRADVRSPGMAFLGGGCAW